MDPNISVVEVAPPEPPTDWTEILIRALTEEEELHAEALKIARKAHMLNKVYPADQAQRTQLIEKAFEFHFITALFFSSDGRVEKLDSKELFRSACESVQWHRVSDYFLEATK